MKPDWSNKTPEDILDYFYDELEDDNTRFEFLKKLMLQLPDLEIDWIEAFEDIKEHLLINERIDDILFFVNWINNKYPEDYKNRYEFIESDLCNYYLFKKDYQSLQKRLSFIQQHPVSAIDTLTERILFQLIYHGQREMAVEFANMVWKPIDESPDLIGHAAYNFVNTIYINQLQLCYEAFLENRDFDLNAMFEKIVKMGFDNNKKEFNNYISILKSDLDLQIINNSVKKEKLEHMAHLNIHFLKYMHQEYNLPFIFSEIIWQLIAYKEIFGKHGIDNWFFIDVKTLDEHIGRKYDNFYGSNEIEMFGKVWGLNYVFSFFNHYNLITNEPYEEIKENILHFKKEMMILAEADLWKMSFVFDWPKIESIENKHITKDFFNSTFKIKELESTKYISDTISTIPKNERIESELRSNTNRLNENTFYSGDTPYVKESPDIGRNDPCPCGSGKKYKKCCLNN